MYLKGQVTWSCTQAQHLQPASKELQLALVVERDAQLPSNTTENDIFEDPLDIPPAAGSADDCRSESLLAEIKTLREMSLFAAVSSLIRRSHHQSTLFTLSMPSMGAGW